VNRKSIFLLASIFIGLLLHASTIGLTDDEAYYWALAQSPSWGYAYHPPVVAWCIWLSEQLFGWVSSNPQPGVVRLPAVLLTVLLILGAILFLKFARHDLKRFHLIEGAQSPGSLRRGVVAFIGFAGIFGVSWMIVPDLPLVGAWLGLYLLTWKICFQGYTRNRAVLLGFSVALGAMSKFSALFPVISSFICLVIWTSRAEKKSDLYKSIAAILIGGLIGIIPTLIWNAQNDWGSILYQIRDRHHGSEFNLSRYFRFWLITLVGAGPALFTFFFQIIGRLRSKSPQMKTLARFTFIWIVPAAIVFCVQPAFSDFKPHWVLIVFIPVLFEFAFHADQRWINKLFKLHVAYGYTIIVMVFLSFQVPIISWTTALITGKQLDSRLDITNDVYGWDGIAEYVAQVGGARLLELPMAGSRYQTAAQARFVWPHPENVSRIPRTKKEFKEWPTLASVSEQGPDWPMLNSEMLFVADTRYHQPPEFRNSSCVLLGRKKTFRFSVESRWVEVYHCKPIE